MGKETILVVQKKKRTVTFMGLQKGVNKNISTWGSSRGHILNNPEYTIKKKVYSFLFLNEAWSNSSSLL